MSRWDDFMTAEQQKVLVEASVSEAAYHDYVLAELRAARKRAQLLVNEIETIGLALKGGMIAADMAVIWLNDAQGLGFLIPVPHDTSQNPSLG